MIISGRTTSTDPLLQTRTSLFGLRLARAFGGVALISLGLYVCTRINMEGKRGLVLVKQQPTSNINNMLQLLQQMQLYNSNNEVSYTTLTRTLLACTSTHATTQRILSP